MFPKFANNVATAVFTFISDFSKQPKMLQNILATFVGKCQK